MPINVKIKNIGKLEDAQIRIDRFTVLAGPNNSGKSFVSKTVYSVIEALNCNYVKRYFQQLFSPIFDDNYVWNMGVEFDNEFDVVETEPGKQIRAILRNLEECVTSSQYRNTEEINKTASNLIDGINEVLMILTPSIGLEANSFFRGELEYAFNALNEVKIKLAKEDAHQIVKKARSEELQRRFISNFQISKVSQIRNEQEQSLVVDIDQIGKFEYSQGGFSSQLLVPWPHRSIGFSTIIYLESPIYLKLMRVLTSRDLRDQFRFSHGRRLRLSGVPGYFYNLVDLLKFDRSGDIAFPEIYKRLTGTEIMGGQLTISDDGNILFQENGKRFPLSITATGIANIGILSLLIERKVLDRDSLLFVDEPEAHLHPAWQVFLAESLFELARQGVTVVIATHSLEILKWLEVHVKKNPEDKEFVALNRFPMLNQPIIDNIEPRDFESQLNQIKEELTKPFRKLYFDGL